MRHYIAKVEIDWADEILFHFTEVLDEDQKKEWDELLKKWRAVCPEKRVRVSFGTNEDGEYSLKEVAKAVKLQQISEEEYEVLRKLDLQRVGKGVTGLMLDIDEAVEEE